MEKQTAIQILKSRVLIPSAGKYTVKCTTTNPFMREDGTMVNIVNFNALTPYQADLAKKAFQAGDYEGATGKGTSLSTSQLNGQYVPSKGEIVDIEVGEIYSENAEANILVVTSIVPRKAVVAKAFSFDELEEPVQAEPAIA